MKRIVGLLVLGLLAVVPVPAQAQGQEVKQYVADAKTKIDVMGEWAHPDDDTSFIGPCGVWHQLY
ncbi:MAG TPA: hypothetical protein VG497_22155, partial [Kribbella sp.]|nr:hypothetical protein [Kribbella sp.]